MLRYTVLRLLIFFGFLVLFWLVGLRENQVLLLGAAALASAVASYALLRGMRDEMTAKLMDRHESRLRAREEGRLASDEAAEDREAEDREAEDREAEDREAEDREAEADR